MADFAHAAAAAICVELFFFRAVAAMPAADFLCRLRAMMPRRFFAIFARYAFMILHAPAMMFTP